MPIHVQMLMLATALLMLGLYFAAVIALHATRKIRAARKARRVVFNRQCSAIDADLVECGKIRAELYRWHTASVEEFDAAIKTEILESA